MANNTLSLNASANASANASDTNNIDTMSAWDLFQSSEFMAIEVRMLFSAIFIIYVGAHASLRRPHSAAPPETTKKTKRTKDGKPCNDKECLVGGFEATDAIFLPIIMGFVLTGLYYLIIWLGNADILNTLLRCYMSVTGTMAMGTLLGNSIQLLLCLVFPGQWRDSKGAIWTVDSACRKQISNGSDDNGRGLKMTPLPGLASHLPLSSHRCKRLFKLRHLLLEDWHLQLNITGICNENIAYKLTTLYGYLLGVLLQTAYLLFGGKSLSNIIALGVCYSAFNYISLTSFPIGSSILFGLFIYDIVMVFYTPFMVGVATHIDAPIMLSFQTATRSSMLGLGDIVLPGFFICLALRFDLWMHYRRQIKQVETELETVSKVDVPDTGSGSETTTKEVTTITKVNRDVKAPFVDPRGQWGNYFWTTTWRNLLVGGDSSAKAVADCTFPKTYFYATIVGYSVGMVITIVVMLYAKHGQPALLYLVPGVIGSLYFTGFMRGELRDLTLYTENGSLDTEDVVVDVDGEGKPVVAESDDSKDGPKGDGAKDGDVKGGKNTGEDEQDEGHEVLMLVITAPREEVYPKED